MAKESQQKIADRLSESLGFPVTRDMVRQWVKKGYDIDDVESLRFDLNQQQRVPLGMDDEQVDTTPVEASELAAQIEELRVQILAAKDKKTAETIKIKILAMGSIQRQLIEQGKYILKDDAQSAGMAAGVASRGAWEKIAADLPPMLEGLTALQMVPKLRDYARAQCLELAEHFQS